MGGGKEEEVLPEPQAWHYSVSIVWHLWARMPAHYPLAPRPLSLSSGSVGEGPPALPWSKKEAPAPRCPAPAQCSSPCPWEPALLPQRPGHHLPLREASPGWGRGSSSSLVALWGTAVNPKGQRNNCPPLTWTQPRGGLERGAKRGRGGRGRGREAGRA